MKLKDSTDVHIVVFPINRVITCTIAVFSVS